MGNKEGELNEETYKSNPKHSTKDLIMLEKQPIILHK